MVASAFVALEERVVGGYRLERRLGKGGMGEVWLGRHVGSRGLAAVKMVTSGAVRDAVRSFFETERRAIGRLCHPNIVGLYDVGPDYLVCQFVDGTDLAHRLRSPIKPRDAVLIAGQVASGLAHAHDLGVIHRDVKPSNVLLDRDENAYLADFGVARIVGELQPEDDLVVGTPAFMAPEQQDGRATAAADQYALARTLLVMLAGGKAPIEPEEALEALPAATPAALRDVIARATRRDPKGRFPSVRAFADALAAVDLDAFHEAATLAPALREPTAFAWCREPRATSTIGSDIMRADYLFGGDDLPASFRELSGFSQVGFAVFGRTARLGRVNDPLAFARASEIVVLLHGLFGNRDSWRHVAEAICRANGQAIVIAPDCLGFGETRFVDEIPDRALLAPASIPRVALALLERLGLAGVPTVLVGHSAGAIGVLAPGGAELPPNVHRVAITPVFADVNVALRVRLFLLFALVRILSAFGPTKRWLARKFAYNPNTHAYGEEDKELMRTSFLATPGARLRRLFAAYSAERPATGDRLRRTMIIVVGDVAPADQMTRMLRDSGFPEDKLFRLSEGAHFPHSTGGEYTARNVSDIITVVDAVLDSTRVGRTTSVESGETGTETVQSGPD
jgi:serine/threonine-protein kinase